MLDDEINNTLEKLDVNLTTLELRCIFCEKPYDFKKERELRLSAKKINKIEELKEEVKNNGDELLDHLLDGETKVSRLLNDLKYEKHDALHKIIVIESKLIKLEISLNELIELKIRFYNLILCYCKSKSNLKTMFLK